MALIHNNVFDAALTYISANAVEAEVRKTSSGILVSAVTLDGGNFGANGEYASGGRKIQCLVSSASDILAISVDAAGDATKVALLNASGAAVLIVASITSSPITLGASDQVNLLTFSVILKDPT